MIYVTGDIHGTKSIGKRLSLRHFPEQEALTKDDYLIIAGDFGFPWKGDEEDVRWLNWLNHEKPFTTIFIDGNRDNFELLDAYDVETWHGGKVHHINDSVIHLMRGQVFTIENRSFFTFGGAKSMRRNVQTEGKSWWSRGMPSDVEYREGMRNLLHQKWTVDYVITHTCPKASVEAIANQCGFRAEFDETHTFFQMIQEKLAYQKWFFGHFHRDFELPNGQRLIYEDILPLIS